MDATQTPAAIAHQLGATAHTKEQHKAAADAYYQAAMAYPANSYERKSMLRTWQSHRRAERNAAR